MQKDLVIKICMGSSCFARGNNDNLLLIEEFIEENGLDATIELVGSRCEGKCADGPHISINDKEYKCVKRSELKGLLRDNLLLVKGG